MRCKQAERRISQWLDGQISAQEIARLQSHLAACGACRAAEQWQRGLSADLRMAAQAAARLEPSAGFDASFQRRLAGISSLRWLDNLRDWLLPNPSWTFSRAMAMVLMGLLLGGAGGVYSGLREIGAGPEWSPPAAQYLSYAHDVRASLGEGEMR